MNTYHLKVIIGNNIQQQSINADIVGWSDAGLYEFVSLSSGARRVVAYYPVNSTIIETIEYDVDKETK